METLKPQQWKETWKNVWWFPPSSHSVGGCYLHSNRYKTHFLLSAASLFRHTPPPLWDYTHSRYDKTCTTAWVPAESSLPQRQRGRPRQGGGGQSKWKQIEGKWCLASSYALIAFFFFFCRVAHAREKPRQKPPLLLETERVASLLWKSRCFCSCEKIGSVVWSFDSLCVWADSGLRPTAWRPFLHDTDGKKNPHPAQRF